MRRIMVDHRRGHHPHHLHPFRCKASGKIKVMGSGKVEHLSHRRHLPLHKLQTFGKIRTALSSSGVKVMQTIVRPEMHIVVIIRVDGKESPISTEFEMSLENGNNTAALVDVHVRM